MALCKIFEYGINTQDQRLVSVMLQETVEIPNANLKARTRSQAANNRQIINVPIMVKIFRLLINELSNLREVKSAADTSFIPSDEEDSSEDITGIDENGKNMNAFMLFDDGKIFLKIFTFFHKIINIS